MPEPEGNDYSDDDGGLDSGDDLRDIVSQFNNKSAGSAVNFNANGEFIHNQPYGGPDLLSKLNLDVETATIRSRFTEYSMSSSILPRSEGKPFARSPCAHVCERTPYATSPRCHLQPCFSQAFSVAAVSLCVLVLS